MFGSTAVRNTSDCAKSYALSGGGVVTVYKPFGERNYSALVKQRGRYPEGAKFARNRGRREYSVVISGSFTYVVDGVSSVLEADDTILVGDGQRYCIDGTGTVLVMIEDQEGGATIIED